MKKSKLLKNNLWYLFFFLEILCLGVLMMPWVASAQNNQRTYLLDASKRQLLVPIRNIQSDYTDNTTKLPQIEYSDSYLSELSDQIVFQRLSKSFKSVELLTDTADIEKIYSAIISLRKETGIILSDDFQKNIQEIAKKYTVDFVVIPGCCILKYKTIHQKGWREARGGSNYERPVTEIAFSEYKIWFFQKDGILNREGSGSAKSVKPVLYSYLKKKNFEKNIVENSRKRYAPPLLRALSKSIDNALNNLNSAEE